MLLHARFFLKKETFQSILLSFRPIAVRLYHLSRRAKGTRNSDIHAKDPPPDLILLITVRVPILVESGQPRLMRVVPEHHVPQKSPQGPRHEAPKGESDVGYGDGVEIVSAGSVDGDQYRADGSEEWRGR